jgi:TolB-like protein/tetratricopeptide (TPR) repeat protein
MPSRSGSEAESGQPLGHYRLLESIGTGGMGVVYRARDERLERDVAIKVLPHGRLLDETARKRFRTEALALSRLNHPNIATVHDFDADAGIDFLVMEYIPGASLDTRVREGGLSDAEVRHIGVQLAHGLRAAHERGVIHGDLKPSNLRLTPDGRLKILDFGLARLLQSVSSDEADITRTEEVTGTLPYMAPERLHGGGIDIRTDIYAVGAVLYELAAGRRLFGNASGSELWRAILTQEPDPPRACNPRISESLDSVIRTALAKDPIQRQQSADDLVRDLERPEGDTVQRHPRGLRRRRLIGLAAAVPVVVLAVYMFSRHEAISPPPSARITIAVLPFHTLGVSEPLRFLGIGIPDAIITRLAVVQHLAPRPTSAILRYENQPVEPIEVGRVLTSDYVVTGILQEVGDRLRISVQLVRARDGAPLWGYPYDVARSDLLGLQDQVAQAVADALQVRMSAMERTRLFKRYTENTAAYELYLKGRAQLSRFTPGDLTAAVASFEEAIRLDPNDAPAYGGLAMASAAIRLGGAPASEAQAWAERAERAARTALRLEPQLAEGHEALAAVHRGVEFDWDGTLEESRLALELNPNLDRPHFYRAAAFYHLGLLDLIEPELRAAVDVNPTNQIDSLTIRGNAALFSGRFREAIPLLEDAERLSHNTMSSSYLAQAYNGAGNAVQAENLLTRLDGNTPGDRRAQAVLASLLAARRERDKAMALVRNILASNYMDHHVAYSLGATYAQLGERAEATRWLTQSARDGFHCYPWFRRDRLLDPLRSDAGYQRLLAHLSQVWEANKARYGSRATIDADSR